MRGVVARGPAIRNDSILLGIYSGNLRLEIIIGEAQKWARNHLMKDAP